MKTRDTRWRTLWLTVVAVAALGSAIALQPNLSHWFETWRPSTAASAIAPQRARPASSWTTAEDEIAGRFEQAKLMLHARRYDYAAAALRRLLQLAPTMPEAHVNMGFALLGQQQFAAARDFFKSALQLHAGQTNAYYGLAVALEGLCDLSGAVGAMRTFLHLTPVPDRYTRKARAALWEWQAAGARDTTTAAERCRPDEAATRLQSESRTADGQAAAG